LSDKLIEIRLAGGPDVVPGRIRSKDLAEVIEAVEDMIASVIVRDNPKLSKDNLVIGLTNIKDESVGLQFSPQPGELAFEALSIISEAIEEDSYENLPSSTIKSLQNVSTFTKRHDCTAHFTSNNGDQVTYATITPETEITYPSPLKGETVIYGNVLRVGGKTPKVMFETVGGDVLYCDSDRETAKKLGKKLYELVGLQGIAQWDAIDLHIVAFNIGGITDYTKTSISDSFKQLSGLIGEHFSDIDDVDGYISEIRSGERME